MLNYRGTEKLQDENSVPLWLRKLNHQNGILFQLRSVAEQLKQDHEFNPNPKRQRGTSTESLADASGYEIKLESGSYSGHAPAETTEDSQRNGVLSDTSAFFSSATSALRVSLVARK